MRMLETYIGIEPFTVKVDDSAKLQELARQARELRGLPFSERLFAVKGLALDAMVNAYEQMVVWERKVEEPEGDVDLVEAKKQLARFQDIVFREHPLSYALEQEAGCCRYQGALFFILGYEADLGDKHFIQAAPVNPGVNTVFNELVVDGRSIVVSIFTESLKDKSLDYSRQNPQIFEQAFESVPGFNMYSYHRTASGLVIAENQTRHVRELGE